MKRFPDFHPRFGLRPKITFETIVAKFGDGYSQRGAAGINNRIDEWPLTFALLDEDCKEIVDFIDDHEGHKEFLWSPPSLTEGTYICDGYTGPVRIGINHSEVRCTFRRVY